MASGLSRNNDKYMTFVTAREWHIATHSRRRLRVTRSLQTRVMQLHDRGVPPPLHTGRLELIAATLSLIETEGRNRESKHGSKRRDRDVAAAGKRRELAAMVGGETPCASRTLRVPYLVRHPA